MQLEADIERLKKERSDYVRLRVEGELARERESKRVLQQNLDKERARNAALQAQLHDT